MFHLSTVEENTYAILKGIFQIPEIKKDFALAGRTSLALQLGHRCSIDLDVFSPKSFNPRDIEILLSIQEGFSFDLVNSTKSMLFCYINKIKGTSIN